MSERKTRPATEKDLIAPNGSHAMCPNDGTPFKLRATLVDGIQPELESIHSERTVNEYVFCSTMNTMN